MAKATNTAFFLPGTEKIEENATGTVVSAERAYQVLTTFGATVATALAATDLPATNSQHPVYTYLRVVSRSPELEQNGIRWIITIKYAASNLASETYHLVRLEYGTHSIQEDVIYNRGNDKPILDANDKPFESTIQEPVEYPYIKIVKQQKSVNRSDVMYISGTINDAQIVVAGVTLGPKTGRIKIVATEQPESTWPWEITYQVMVKNFTIKNYLDFALVKQDGPTDIGWDVAIVNRGYYYYDPGSGNDKCRALEDILDNDGNVIEQRPTASPVLLDENGERLAAGAAPLFVRVQTIRSASWANLGLNNL